MSCVPAAVKPYRSNRADRTKTMAFCTNCGSNENGKFCSKCGAPISAAPRPTLNRLPSTNTDESCPKCNNIVTPADDSVVQAGIKYHRACFGYQHAQPKSQVIDHDELCPSCGKTVSQQSGRSDNAADVIISGGKQYHRSCFGIKEVQPKVQHISHDELCSKCNKTVSQRTIGGDAADVIISGGKQYHRSCFDIKEVQPKVQHISHDELCSKCNKTVSQRAKNGEAADVIISGGNQYHRACFGIPEPAAPQRIFKGVPDVCPGCSVAVAHVDAIYKQGMPYHRDCYYKV
eukprot:TRINITY_DN718_c0_g1_i1.p1 TRINITY_DN718_c0_g1~~TRINITY_DN718_c0_g1_i1.p1  ORF type:complete len:289 (-),score=65.50 TRINITY_DN718_c0_g1_i1:88-954(-)